MKQFPWPLRSSLPLADVGGEGGGIESAEAKIITM